MTRPGHDLDHPDHGHRLHRGGQHSLRGDDDPLIESMAGKLGGAEPLMPIWWALAPGSCLGGNGSLVGASANLIVAGFAERAGHPLSLLRFMLIAFPLMPGSILISTFPVHLRYL